MVEDIRAGGFVSRRAISPEMNARGILARRGGFWHKSTVINLLKRLDQPAGTAMNPAKAA